MMDRANGKLAGKVAVVTGGNSGIGLGVAKEFYEHGAKVVISGRNPQSLREAVAEITGEGGQADDLLTIEADVRDITALTRLFSETKARFGGVDVLFANAGVVGVAPLGAVTEAAFDEIMDINFKGAFFTLQEALPVLNDNASIILNGSVNAYVGYGNLSIYSASKAALHSLARTLSAELIGRGIRVNTLTIGPIATGLISKTGLPPEGIQAFAEALTARLPVRRFGTVDEVAKAALFLASPDSSALVGSEITTDGGLMINGL